MGSYFPPPSGGSGLTLPTDTGGFGGGMLAIEYDGSALPLSDGVTIAFDTAYTDEATSDTVALTDPIPLDSFTFAPSGITLDGAQFCAVFVEVDFDGSLDHPASVSIGHGLGLSGLGGAVWVPAGATGYMTSFTAPYRDGDQISSPVITADPAETASLSYAVIALVKLADLG